MNGGGKRDRTADLLHAMQALSQLSYTPFGFLLIVHFVHNRKISFNLLSAVQPSP